jgi:hypothetical protein
MPLRLRSDGWPATRATLGDGSIEESTLLTYMSMQGRLAWRSGKFEPHENDAELVSEAFSIDDPIGRSATDYDVRELAA